MTGARRPRLDLGLLGRRVMAARRSAEVSRGELAYRIGVSKSTVVRIEQGTTCMSVEAFWRLLVEFDLSPAQLLGLSPMPEQVARTLVFGQRGAQAMDLGGCP